LLLSESNAAEGLDCSSNAFADLTPGCPQYKGQVK
jgi:hypothetical protein